LFEGFLVAALLTSQVQGLLLPICPLTVSWSYHSCSQSFFLSLLFVRVLVHLIRAATWPFSHTRYHLTTFPLVVGMAYAKVPCMGELNGHLSYFPS
jgi:hypothetical protein